MRPFAEGERVLRIESFGIAMTTTMALTLGGAALGIAAGIGTYGAISTDHDAQLQTAENAASTVLNQYGGAMSSLPEACKLVIKDAMKGSLDNPLDIITAANKSGTCQDNMNEITTVTYQYHDKMLQAEKDTADAYKSLQADGSAAGCVGVLTGVIGTAAGWSLGLGLMFGIPIGRRKVKNESAQPLVVQQETNVPELTTGENEDQSAASAQQPEEPSVYVVAHEDYAYQDDMR